MGTTPKGDVKVTGEGNSLAVQWSGLGASTAGGPGSISGRGTKIAQGAWRSQKKKKKVTGEEKIQNMKFIYLGK